MSLQEYSKEEAISNRQLHTLSSTLKIALSGIKDQFDDHLTAINENTNEIQANYEYLAELDQKLDKLTERLDKLQMFIEQQAGKPVEEKQEFSFEKLTRREEEAYLILSALNASKGAVTYAEIAKRAMLPEELVIDCISSLLSKQVPIQKKLMSKRIYLRIDTNFRILQERKNIMNLSQKPLVF